MSKQKKKLHVLRRLLLIVAAILLGLNIYKWNAQSLMGNQLPMPFGYGISVVMSGSMEPTLQVDDLVVIRETDTVQVSDIIVYQSRDSLVIHRVLEIDGDSIVTRGDANNAADEAIALSDVKGVMVASVPRIGAVVQFVKQPAVVAVILIAAVALTELSFRRDKQKDRKELEDIEDEIRRLMAEIKEES